MKIPFDLPRTTRRDFLLRSGQALGFLAFHSVAPSFLTRPLQAGQLPAAERDRRILVLVQLAGGNDGLNTVVPYTDDRYFNLRPSLAVSPEDVLPLNDDLGLHGSCGGLYNLHQEGLLSTIQNVGYPNPNRSHFRSMEIWETASDSDTYESSGWLGRYFDHACAGSPDGDPPGVYLTDQTPQLFVGEDTHGTYGTSGGGGGQGVRDLDLLQKLGSPQADASSERGFLSHTLMDALAMDEKVAALFRNYRTPVRYPGNRLGNSLKNVASLIAANYGTRVYFVSHGGFDTHVRQADTHARLLEQLSDSLAAFQRDLTEKGLQDQVLTMTFSEFGRRPNENESGGTDHGTAAPLFVMGSHLQQNIVGDPPDLAVEKNRDITYTTDFRQVYGTVLEDWLNTPSAPVLGRDFSKLPILRTY